MLIDLNYKKLRIFDAALDLLEECYIVTQLVPSDEKFGMVRQIRRAALSVVLNIAEGSSRYTLLEKRRFYEIARGSVVEIDAAFTAALRLKYFAEMQLETVGRFLNKCFAMLSKMITTLSSMSK